MPPYHFAISIHSHRYKKYHFDLYDRSNAAYKKAYLFNGNPVLAEIRCVGSVDKPRLNVVLRAKKLDPDTVRGIKSQIRKQFLADTDMSMFYKKIAKDKVLSMLTKKFYGLKPNWPGDLFECVTRCIISQQINVTFADKVEMHYVQKFGKKINYNGEIFFIYPDPQAVSQITKKDLLKIQFSERKAEYLIDLAQSIVSGSVDFHTLVSLKPEAFIDEITKIRGIGRWTAECSLMHLGHRHILPKGDIGLHQAIRRFYHFKKNTTVETLLKVADHWRGWESIATYYLWHALTHDRMKTQVA